MNQHSAVICASTQGADADRVQAAGPALQMSTPCLNKIIVLNVIFFVFFLGGGWNCSPRIWDNRVWMQQIYLFITRLNL